MTKRILSALLAMTIFTACFPVQVLAEERQDSQYIVSMTDNLKGQSVGIGDRVSVTVTVTGTDPSVTAYNAYDLKFIYDETHLAYRSAKKADANAEITAENNRIHVKGFGHNKTFSAPVVVLTFEVLKPGSTDILLNQAKVDFSDNAGQKNTPDAQIAAAGKTVTIPVEGFEVLVDGNGVRVKDNCYVAVSEKDFVFCLEDFNLYNYQVVVKVDNVNITSKVVRDKTTGTYTIPKDQIDGNVKILVEREPKTFAVKLTGDDVSGAKTAQYNTDYSFRLEREKDYLYSVQVTIDGKEYTGYTVEGDVYTIPGADIKGKINIKMTRQEDDSNKAYVSFVGTGSKDGSGQKKTLIGVEYPFTVKRKKGYTYSVKVYVDGKRTAYDYDSELDMYYIAPEDVHGQINIVISKIATVEVSEYITLDKESMFLVLYHGNVGEGQVPRYDGRSMYWSDRYNAYVWLVMSGDSEKKVKKTAEGAILVNEGTAAGTVDYSGNVNMTLRTDEEDVRMAWEMYEGKHSLNFMEMQKLLNADVLSDRKLNVRDAAAIVKKIS